MTLGSSNTPIEGSEIDVASIVESAIEHISLDGSGNVEIPNGGLTTGDIFSQDGSERLSFDGGAGSDTVLRSGSGSTITVWDSTNSQRIIDANEGGSVDIPNGDLTDGTNVIYDNSETHIPRARLDGNKITSVITTDTTTSNEEILYVDTAGGPVTITLASADAVDGNEITIVAAGGSAETNPITIATEGAETIDGASTTTISKNYSAQAIASDGTNWFTTGAGGGATAISEVTIDANKDWQNFDISNVRRFAAEDGVINGKTLETGNSMTIEDDESMVVSESYTIDGDLTINGSGSLTVI